MNNPLTKRLRTLYSELKGGGTFADVGCDHGYIAEKVLENGLFDEVIISDISEKCLKKAESRLSLRFGGRFTAIVSDGFDNLPHVDEALISGMGGEIISAMLARRDDKPSRLVLQPMKNAEKVRRFLVENGYFITRDYTFKDKKYYHVVVAEKPGENPGENSGENSREKDEYTDDEYLFGRDNLKEKSDDFKEFVGDKIKLFSEAAANADSPEREELFKKTEKLRKIIE